MKELSDADSILFGAIIGLCLVSYLFAGIVIVTVMS